MTLKNITKRRRLLLCFFSVAIATSYPPLIAKNTTALAFFNNKSMENPIYGKRNINHVLLHDTQKVYGVVINTGYYNFTDREKTEILQLMPHNKILELVFGKGLLFTGFLLTPQWPLFPIKTCCL